MNSKKYDTVGTISKSNFKLVETEAKWISLTHITDLKGRLLC